MALTDVSKGKWHFLTGTPLECMSYLNNLPHNGFHIISVNHDKIPPVLVTMVICIIGESIE